MKVMISQPMAGKSNEEIIEARKRAEQYLNSLGHEVVDTLFINAMAEYSSESGEKNNGILNISLYCLSKALAKMAECEAVYFCKGYRKARGCQIEKLVAKSYGLEIMEED